MANRYFSDAPIDGERACLTGSEAHHVAHVMRGKPGDTVLLFDGSGAEFEARVERVGRAEVELVVVERRDVSRELPCRLTLAVALPKGDRQRWLVEKATELGVARLIPLTTERAGPAAGEAALGKLRRAVIEASKQCGRNRLMEIAPATPLEKVLAEPAPAARWMAHPGGAEIAGALAGPAAEPYLLAIGPEGGFTAAEVAAAGRHGWRLVGLGRSILRVETAALALTGALALRMRA